MIYIIIGIGIFLFIFLLFLLILFLIILPSNNCEETIQIDLEINADILKDFDTYLTYNQASTLFKAKLGSDIAFVGLDSQYKILHLDNLQTFLQYDQTNELPYIPDSLDCDDYARILQGNVLKSAAKHVVEKGEEFISGIAFGTLYGDISLFGEPPTPHALNVAVVKEGENSYQLVLIEPQTDQILQPNNLSTYWLVVF